MVKTIQVCCSNGRLVNLDQLVKETCSESKKSIQSFLASISMRRIWGGNAPHSLGKRGLYRLCVLRFMEGQGLYAVSYVLMGEK